MGTYNFPEDITDQVISQKGQLERMQRSSQLGNSSIPGAGGSLGLDQLAFGEVWETTAATFACNADGAWHADGLETPLTVVCQTGRMLVAVSAVLFSSLGHCNVVMSWQVVDALTSVVTISPNNQRALVMPQDSPPSQAYNSATYEFGHTTADGLVAGRTYIVQTLYRGDNYGGPVDLAQFENRTLRVKPS